MIHESRTLDETIAFLNELVRIDPEAVRQLVETRVDCNQAMVDHPSVIVVGSRVGLLGILNGLFGGESVAGGYSGAISAFLDDYGNILRFERKKKTGA